jgi:hypothetical protein
MSATLKSYRIMNTCNTDVQITLASDRRLQKDQRGFYYAIKTDEGTASEVARDV